MTIFGNDPLSPGVAHGYALGFFIGDHVEHMTPHEIHRLDTLYALIKKYGGTWQATRWLDNFEQYAWRVRDRIEGADRDPTV